jgi:hypothetical protein
MRQHSASAAKLAAELEQDIQTHTRVYGAIDCAQREMIAAVREERLKVFGHEAKAGGHSDPSAEAKQVGALLFLGPRTIDLDGWTREDRQRPFKEWAGYRGPYFDRLHFRTKEVVALWPPQPPESDTSEAAYGTIAEEARLTKWLVEQMTAAPSTPRSKEAMQQEATDAGLKFTDRAFERSWSAAVEKSRASAWSRPGRRKSPRRIDTPN